MAQVKKIEIQERILKEARKEFLKIGFQGANLRDIAAASGISLANLYSYHDSKDALFCTVIQNLRADLEAVERFFLTYQPESATLDPIELELKRAKLAAAYIYKHRTDFHLLFNQSNGSSLEDYPERLVEGYVINCRKFLTFLKKKRFPLPNIPSDFFFASVGRLFVEATRAAVRSNLSQKAIYAYAQELARYNHSGFRGVSGDNQQENKV